MPNDNEDLTDGYLQHSTAASSSTDSQEMEAWIKNNFNPGIQDQPLVSAVPPRGDVQSRPLPEPKPVRSESDQSTGRKASPESGGFSRSVSEMPRQAAGGVIDAVHNAFSIIDPLGQWLNDHVADLRFDDTVAAPKTTTGAITRKMSEFLTGFIPAIKGLKALGVENAAVRGIAGGGIADFLVRDPHEGRLSDFWNEAGLPKNVLTDYLASKPDDSEAEGRFKNAIESIGLGAATEGVMLAARTLRAARSVKEAQTAEIDYLRGKYGELTDAEFATLGDTKSPVLTEAGKVKSVASKLEALTEYGDKKLAAWMRTGLREGDPVLEYGDKKLAALARVRIKAGDMEGLGLPIEPRALVRAAKGQNLPEDWGYYINFAKIDEPKQIQFAIGKMAEAMKPHITEATRGSLTQAETKAMADDLGMSVADLLARRKGQAFNAEEAMAARQLWAASGERLVEAAKLAAGKNAGPVDQFNFRKMMAIHSAIQAEVLGARAEAGRGLASWAIPAGSDMEKARAIDQIMGAMGGPGESAGMARRLAMLAEAGADPAAIARFAEKGATATTMDAVKEVWVNGLLSSPTTHVVNVMSNSLVAMSTIYERATAGAFRSMIGGDGVRLGEAGAMTHGVIESTRDAFRMAARALKTGETGMALGKIDLPHQGNISSEAFRISKETGMGRFVDFLGNVVDVPGRLLGAEDEFFKTVGYRMELRAQAFRQASSEGHIGEDFAKRYQALVDNPTDALRVNSADAALYNTFTNEVGWFGNAIMNLRNAGSSMNPAFFVLPFVRTPVNIARYAFERTPFAPLVGQWRADIAAGGARADLALAKMSTGTAIMLTAMDYADSGLISGDGPRDKDKDVREAMLREGWQPYSVKIGNRWVSYNRADPFGMTVGFAASIAEAVRKGEIDKNDVDEWQEVTAMAIAAVSQVTINKTYMEGFANVVEVMSDPKRYTQKYVDDLFASFTPAASLSNSVKNMVDPMQREVNNPMEAVMARIAYLSERLPPRRNLWGREITAASGLGNFYDFLSPAKSKAEDVQPIDKEIVRIGDGPQRIQKLTTIDGVQANFKPYPKAYDDYTRLAGNDLKHPAWGMGAMDYLNSVVSGQHPMSAVYNIMSDQSRKDFISSTVSDYRRLAAQQVLQDPKHKFFAEEVRRLQEINRNNKMPVLGDPNALPSPMSGVRG